MGSALLWKQAHVFTLQLEGDEILCESDDNLCGKCFRVFLNPHERIKEERSSSEEGQ